MFGNNRIQYQKENISCRYKTQILGDMKMGSMHNKTFIENEHIYTIKKVFEDGYLVELILLNQELKESSLEGYTQLFYITKQFNSVFNELHFTVSNKGQVLEVKNTEQIKARWASVKNEIKAFGKTSEETLQMLQLNDEIFEDETKLRSIVQANEFVFTHLDCSTLGYTPPNAKTLKKNNAFGNIELNWRIGFREEPISTKHDANTPQMKIEGLAAVSSKDVKEKYGTLPFMANVPLDPSFVIDGIYQLDCNNMLDRGEISVREQAHPAYLYHHIQYHFQKID